MVYGERVRISLADLGCTSTSIIQNARCALEHLKDSFGIETAADEVNPENVRTNSRGDTVVLFSQLYKGFNVFAGYINMVKANPSNGVVEQLHGYGKY